MWTHDQDPSTSWAEVLPQPLVVGSFSGGSTGDERRYNVAYVFDGDKRQTMQADGSAVVPLSLKPGTTYVAHLRARNVHGWSDWSTDVVFSGTYDRLDKQDISVLLSLPSVYRLF